jgi:adenine-specific DNA-methyltransferase
MATIQFKGKEIVRNHHLTVPYHELVPDGEKSLTKKVSLNDNLIIHGDNLLALKALLPSYAGKVKCIYIDPPYNIGNEKWAYNDNVNSPMMKEWLGKVVDKDDLTRHDKWLCMMMPRLKLLRELLCDDGAIFISIDDNEQHRLRFLTDDVFGEENFITNIIWQKKYAAASDARFFSDNHDFVVVYAKNKAITEKLGGWVRNLLPRTEKQNALYKYDNKDGKGLWRPDNLTVKTYSKEYDYPIINPTTNREYFPTKGRCWATNKDTMTKWIDERRVFFGKDGKGAPQLKRYLGEVQEGIVPLTIWTYDEVGHTDGARKELKEIFADEKLPFDNPKPTGLIKRIIQIATDQESIVFDSFAGSGTTAQATLALNQEDGGNRKFVLAECEDYAEQITAERVRRVIRGVKNAKDENLQKGLGGSFSYYELGKPIDAERILKGKDLPTFAEMARYVFYTATGGQFNDKKINEKTGLVGESKEYQVYLLYKPDMEYLKSTALTLERAEALGKFSGKKRLVFGPAKYLDQEHLERLHIDFAQLPFEIYLKQ